MSLVSQLQAAFTRVAQEVNDLRSENAMVKLDEIVLGADAANMDFPSIPQTYRCLKLYASVRGAVTGSAFANLLLNVNNITADSGYYREYVQGTGTTAAASESLGAASSRTIHTIPAANAPSGNMAQVEITIFDYANTTRHKPIDIRGSAVWGTTTGAILSRATTLVPTPLTAISRLTLLANSGNLLAGSNAALYGIK